MEPRLSMAFQNLTTFVSAAEAAPSAVILNLSGKFVPAAVDLAREGLRLAMVS
jgi:hypothetical protein